MIFYVLYRSGSWIAGFGLVTNAADLAAGAALLAGTSLLQVDDSTYHQVSINSTSFKAANRAVIVE